MKHVLSKHTGRGRGAMEWGGRTLLALWWQFTNTAEQGGNGRLKVIILQCAGHFKALPLTNPTSDQPTFQR